MNDQILDAPISTFDQVYALWVPHWREVIATVAQWYREAHGGQEPADSDIGHGTVRVLAEGSRWGTLRNGLQNTWPMPVPVPPGGLPDAGERGRVRVDGFVFRREDGSIFPWVGASSFLIVDKLKIGKDVDAILTQLIRPADGQPGANLVRVFSSLDWRNQTGPQFDGGVGPFIDPRDYAATKKAVDKCWSRGLRVELSAGDLVKILPNPQDRIDHMHGLGRTFQGHPGVFMEINEPGHVDQVGADEAATLGKILQSYGILTSYGIYEIPTGTTSIPYGDYCTVHDARKDEWPREPRDCSNFYEGWDWLDANGNVIGHFDGAPVPWVDDEATPADPNSDPNDYAYYGGCAGLLASGATVHGRQLEYSNLLTGRELDCAIEFFRSIRFMSGETKLAAYQRGAAEKDGGGFGPGVGNMPIAHFDLEETTEPRALRSFCKLVNGQEYCVAIRPTQAHVTPRDGWRVDLEPRQGIARLVR